MRQAKIVCTLGPASADVDSICRMIKAGMDVARLNFSHGDWDSHREAYQNVREAARQTEKPVGVIADISGPKIRLGSIQDDAVEIQQNATLVLTTTECLGTAERVSVNYPTLSADVRVGDPIFIDDGLLQLVIERVKGDDVHCRVKAGGVLRSRKGVNLPHVDLSRPAITPKDEKDIAFGRELGVDYFALSFVRHADDVLKAKSLVGNTPVIAKIEKPQAIDHFEAIADVAAGCMVARGDLAIEVGAEKVPMLQKWIIEVMNRRAKPVITATQMLESMVTNPQPTRAEVSDVANAVLDGSDALMLSAESAVGRHPDRVVGTMARVIEEVESAVHSARIRRLSGERGPRIPRNAIAHAAATSAIDLGLKAVAVCTDTGEAPALVSAHRPSSAIVALAADEPILTRMTLLWGVRPVHVARVTSLDECLGQAGQAVVRHGLAESGDDIAVAVCFEREKGIRGTSALFLWKISPRLGD